MPSSLRVILGQLDPPVELGSFAFVFPARDEQRWLTRACEQVRADLVPRCQGPILPRSLRLSVNEQPAAPHPRNRSGNPDGFMGALDDALSY
jgi:hypothetical protein